MTEHAPERIEVTRPSSFREKAIAWLAVCTAIVLTVLYQASSRYGGQRGTAAQAERVNTLMEAGQWPEAAQAAGQMLYSHPFDARTHFQISRCRLEVDLPDVALEHLIWAASGTRTRGPAVLPPPTRDELTTLLGEIAQRNPTTLATPLGLLRSARVAASLDDWPQFYSLLRVMPGDGAAIRCLDGSELFSDVFRIPAVRIAEAGLSDGQLARAVGLIGPTACGLSAGRPGLGMSWKLIATGDAEGNRYRVQFGPMRASEQADGWLLAAVDPNSPAIVCRETISLKALSNERETLEAWWRATQPYPFVFGMASGRAVGEMSREARAALESIVGVSRIPPETVMPNAYVFAVLRMDGVVTVCEASGVASDMPAIAYDCGERGP
ncbi:MAG: hypothetical protein AMXMBFR84_30500 [Candidatus Hydrogenedentota bacterium]